MNILVPDSWLRDFIKTKANVKQIAEYLSLCSQSVERNIPSKNDSIYEIEITSNRPDCLSIYGIAKELNAVLPRFNIKTELVEPKEDKSNLSKIRKPLPLNVEISKNSLCPRFTALIFDNVKIEPSPKIIQERLEKVGIRALNNVIDISNYLMVELGQPMHTFDYDKIKKNKMILRESKEGESVVTIDDKKRKLPKGTMVIEDGEKRLIDLCGIMGGANSEVDENTKRVLLFIQTYDPIKIRQTCQKLSFRTEAASRFEKGVDPEGVIPSIRRAVKMFKDNCNASVASNLIDIYPNPQKTKKIFLMKDKLKEVIGVEINFKEAEKILNNLGFETKIKQNEIEALVPHWRWEDINIPEDLIEEIARIYGYHNIPDNLFIGNIPQDGENQNLTWQNKIKNTLKFLSFNETYNYSMINHQVLKKVKIEEGDCIQIDNPLTEENLMRPSLIPSLLTVISKNQKYQEKIRIFELANIYLPLKEDKLPEENLTLTLVSTKDDFYSLKGILETILKELNIKKYKFNPYELEKTTYGKIFKHNNLAEIIINKEPVGIIGELDHNVRANFNIKEKVIIVDIELDQILKSASSIKNYKPIPKYPAIIEDLTLVVDKNIPVGDILELIKSSSLIIKTVELTDSFKSNFTFRISYQDEKKTLTDKEVKTVREKIIKNLKDKLKIKIKS